MICFRVTMTKLKSLLLAGAIFFVPAYAIGVTRQKSANYSCGHLLATMNAFKLIHDKKFLPNKQSEIKKVEAVAKLVSSMNDNKGPDLLAVVEVDGDFLTQLVRHPLMKKSGLASHGVAPQADDRGNNLGLISRFPLLKGPVAHIYWSEDDPLWRQRKRFGRKEFSGGLLTRPIVEYHLRLPNDEELIVFVNHWPSKKLGDWSALQRFQAARFLKKVTDQILSRNPIANIIIMGDFNAEPDSPEMKAGLGLSMTEKLRNLEEESFNLKKRMADFKAAHPGANKQTIDDYAESLLKERATCFFEAGKRWEVFDQIIVSQNFLKYLQQGSFGPLRHHEFISPSGKPLAFDPVTGSGATDHFPVGGWFCFEP